MYTVAETEVFAADAKSIWSEEDRLEFIGWIAANPFWWLPQSALGAFRHG